MKQQTTTQTPEQTPATLKAIQIAYITKLFDGMWSEKDLVEKRNYCFARVASYAPKATKPEAKVSDYLTADEIGNIISELTTRQFNNRIRGKATKLGAFPTEE